MEMFSPDFICLQFGFVNFCPEKISAKAAYKMSMKFAYFIREIQIIRNILLSFVEPIPYPNVIFCLQKQLF